MLKHVYTFFLILCVNSVSHAEEIRYDYKVITFEKLDSPVIVENELDKLGSEGWQLIEIVPLSINGMNTQLRFFLSKKL